MGRDSNEQGTVTYAVQVGDDPGKSKSHFLFPLYELRLKVSTERKALPILTLVFLTDHAFLPKLKLFLQSAECAFAKRGLKPVLGIPEVPSHDEEDIAEFLHYRLHQWDGSLVSNGAEALVLFGNVAEFLGSPGKIRMLMTKHVGANVGQNVGALPLAATSAPA